MPVAFIMAQIYTMYAVYTMATIMIAAAAAASAAQQASAARSARDAAIKDYYRQLQKGKTESTVFKASKASSRYARINAVKYSSASEQLVAEANAREKFSREKPQSQNRSTEKRLKDFGNQRASFDPDKSDAEGKSIHLLLTEDFTQVDHTQLNFNVENLNTNFFGEV